MIKTNSNNELPYNILKNNMDTTMDYNKLTFYGNNLSSDLQDELQIQLQKSGILNADINLEMPSEDSSAPMLMIYPKDLLKLLELFHENKIIIKELETKIELALRRVTQLKQLNKNADSAKSSFFANMNHEIRTPLNAIIGMSDLLLDTPLDSEQKEFVETVLNSTKSLHYFVNELLDFSKLENETLDLDIIDFDFRVAIEEVVEMYAARAFAKGLDFSCMIDHRIPAMLRGDPARLRQILSHLSDNAIKFTEEGWITIEAKYVREIDQFVAICFEINDSGVGIHEDVIEKILTPFSQGDPGLTRKYGGIGLGLTISQRLIDLMDGTFDISSKENGGTTVTIHLTFEKHKQLPEAIGQTADLSERHFLIVDPNQTNRHVLREMLRLWRTTVQEVENGKQALKAIVSSEKPFDAVILDMNLPDMTGLDLVRSLKNNDGLSHINTLMVTSIGNRGDAAKMKELSISAYLTRPIRHTVLHDTLSELLETDSDTSNDKLITKYSVQETKKQRIRILLVDDSIVNQQIASKIITKLGFRVDTASNGEEAIEALAEKEYDIVFMDVQMPVMDGIDATRHIRQKTRKTNNPDIPVIAMTAHTLPGIQKEFQNAGMNGTIFKPIHPDEVLKAINTYTSHTLIKKEEITGIHEENDIPQQNLESLTTSMKSTHQPKQEPQPLTSSKKPDTQPKQEPPPLAPSETPDKENIFDREALLKRLDNDEEMCVEIVNDFLHDIPELIETIKMSIDQQDFKTISFIAFTIKEGAADISSDPIIKSCENLENAANVEQLDLIKKHYDDLKKQIQELTDTVNPKSFLILVVEDDLSNQKLMSRILSKKNYAYEMVSSGPEALQAMKNKRFDLIFMDVQLPGMDGMETTQRIRNNEPGIVNPKIPIIAVSAHALKDDQSLFKSSGMDDFIEKPIKQEQLFKLIESYKMNHQNSQKQDPLIFDREELMDRIGDDQSIYDSTVKFFKSHVSELLDEVRKAVDTKNVKEIESIAHTIKGVTSNMSAKQMADTALQLENVVQNNQADLAEGIVNKLHEQFLAVQKCF